MGLLFISEEDQTESSITTTTNNNNTESSITTTNNNNTESSITTTNNNNNNNTESSITTTTTTNNNNREINVFTRVQKPCLLFFEELTGSITHALFDPINKILKTIEIPELRFSVQCLSSGHGWLLLLSRQTYSLFFFNPLTRVRIELPYRKNYFDVAAFSASPTSRDCMVFAIEKPYNRTQIHIDVLRVGDPRWTTSTYQSTGFSTAVQAIFCNGIVYCTDSHGTIGSFNADTVTWSVLYESKRPSVRNSYLVESGRELFVGASGHSGDLIAIYKLMKREGEEAVELVRVEELGDDTVFLGPYGSFAFLMRSNQKMEKKVFVAAHRSDRKCAVYKLDGCDCKEEMVYLSTKFDSRYTPIWINPSN